VFRGVLQASSGQVGAARASLVVPSESAGEMLEEFRVAVLADIETALGRPNAAVKLLSTSDGGRSSMRAVAAARAYLALGQLRNAEDALRPNLSGVDAAPTRVVLIATLITQAHVTLARGDEATAVEHLVRACELSAGEIRLPFVRVADVVAELLDRHDSLAALWPTVDIPTGMARAAVPDQLDARLPEALTDRERTVLRWLSTTMSTTEIADELCLSVNTVKTHISAIYRKLAAAKRRDAVLRARTLELL
jgi:LuxR family transcriptional regulator, maltose regulon positive regulatory protein